MDIKSLFNAKIGVALGGGGAKGVAHIGVLKALEEAGVEINYLAGTSVGAMIASMYAFNVNIDTIASIARDLTLAQITTFKINKRGFFTAGPLRKILIQHLGEVNIEDAVIPLAIVATDINSGEEVIFTEGPLADAVCASASIPGVYIPMILNGRTLVDGGIVRNVPVQPLKAMGAGVIIASQLGGLGAYDEPKNVLDVMRNAFDIALSHRTNEEVKEADILIAMDLRDFSIADNTGRHDELFSMGYDAAVKQLINIAWYRQSNILLYLWRIFSVLTPFKVPECMKRTKK
ncbi:MAG: patatin-like phospholipase family protein [Porticoccaceae bacterium]|nr:patatin-like phospholipase family protein [Porticoccaceae bacterium]